MTVGSSGVRRAAPAALVAAMLLLSACADFSGSESAPFTGPPTGQAPKKTQPPTSLPPKVPGPCIDPSRAVVATCLDSPTAVIPTKSIESSIVAQRNGVITYTTTDQPNQELLRLDVDDSGDGGLASIALSPTYDQDRLIYALITTPTDNRVVRVTQGDPPKVVLAGIPKGIAGNLGSLMWTKDGLVVATGNTGDPAAAANPASLAGKVFLMQSHGPNRPPTTKLLATNGGSRSSLCKDESSPDSPLFVADDGPSMDTLRRVGLNGRVDTVWTWPTRPGALGCGVSGNWIAVSQRGIHNLESLTVKDGTAEIETEPVRFKPSSPDEMFGNFGRIGASPEPKKVLAGTLNKQSRTAGPNDDRVVIIVQPEPVGGEGGTD